MPLRQIFKPNIKFTASGVAGAFLVTFLLSSTLSQMSYDAREAEWKAPETTHK